MKRHWLMGALVLVLSAGNVGCYYDQMVGAQRDNGVLRQGLSRAKQELQDAEVMNRQKDTMIDSLNNQLAAKDETIENLTGETQYLRDAFNKAQKILEEQAGKGLGSPVIVKLPQPLHEKLKALAAAHPGLIDYDEKKGAVRWKADLLFPSGKDQLISSTEAIESLKEFAAIVNSDAAAGFDVIIVGHTDTDPIRYSEAEHPTNWHLSAHRAIAVMKLMGQQRVAMTRLGVMGYGEYRPIADNSTEAGKAKNRRVEIYLVSQEAVQSVN